MRKCSLTTRLLAGLSPDDVLAVLRGDGRLDWIDRQLGSATSSRPLRTGSRLVWEGPDQGRRAGRVAWLDRRGLRIAGEDGVWFDLRLVAEPFGTVATWMCAPPVVRVRRRRLRAVAAADLRCLGCAAYDARIERAADQPGARRLPKIR